MGEVMGLPHLVALSLLVVLPAASLAGAQFAAGLALYARLQPDRRATGQAYGLDAVGHLLGGVVTALLLGRGMGSPTLVILAGLASFAGASCPLSLAMPLRLRWVKPLLLAAFVCVGAWLLHHQHGWLMTVSSLRLKMQHPLTEIETVHGSLGVVKYGQGGVYFYVNGVPEFPSPPTPAMQHLVHFPMLQTVNAGAGTRPPTRVLLIGGGAAGGLREVLQYGPQVRVDYVELDPGLIKLARQYLVGRDREALSDPRVRVLTMDGRRWVKQRRTANGVLPPAPSLKGGGKATYDVVLLGVPEPMTAQINRFYTREFFREVAAIMTPAGVIGLQMPSSETYLGDELLRLNAVLVRTVREVFPHVALLPGYEMVVAASRSAPLTEDAQVLRQRLDRLGIEAPDFRAHVWDRLFPFEVAGTRRTLDEAPPLPLNTDARPIGYFYGQAYWVAQHSRTSWAIFDGLSRLSLRALLPAIAGAFALLGIAGLLSRRVAQRFVPLAIVGTGWIAMALQVTLLFAFQVYYGYVYAQLGVLTGAFMLGLAAGSLFVGGRLHRVRPLPALAGVQLVITLVALALPALLSAVGGWTIAGGLLAPHVLFPLLAALVGLTVGAEFPLAAAASRHASAARAGATMYAADLLGACLGALAAGAMLLPVLGLAETCYTAAAVSAGLCVLLLLTLRRSSSA